MLAAAIRAGAQTIVTWNLKDFPKDRLAPFGVQAQDPDEFVVGLLDLQPAAVLQVVTEQAADLRSPPRTVEDVLVTLESNGLNRAVAEWPWTPCRTSNPAASAVRKRVQQILSQLRYSSGAMSQPSSALGPEQLARSQMDAGGVSFRPTARVDLGSLGRGTPCLSAAVCASLAEAAAWCLQEQGHSSGVVMQVNASTTHVDWPPPDPRSSASHADRQEATEDGAVAVAIELIRQGSQMEVVQRSWKGTGFDWFLGPATSGPPFERTSCLEVSGIFQEDAALIARRLDQKVDQAVGWGSGLPGYAVVVGFRGPVAAVRSFP